MTADDASSDISPALLQCGAEGWYRFSRGLREIRAQHPEQVRPALEEVERAVSEGLFAAGFLTYEAATAFDAAFATQPAGKLPLVWFGIYERRKRIELPAAPRPQSLEGGWRPTLDRDAFASAVRRIHERIERGDTYQVNLTWRLESRFESDPWLFFLDLAHRHPTRYAAYLEVDGQVICSLSPELFFRLDGDRLVSRPMKGTSRRGLYPADDDLRRKALRASPKERAENVMIVDMIRNDLGRIARPGSVETPHLFDIETYPSVLQMTSTVVAETDRSLTEILAALFPCASITGAPKIETMRIIDELEQRPRGIYTGAIGYAGPGRQALFNVAIRTVEIDRSKGTAEFGTGGGIVWDSDPESEYEEGLTKARILEPAAADFSLFETLRWRGGRYHLLDRHLDRLQSSADFLGFDCDRPRVRAALAERSKQLVASGSRSTHRVRLLLARKGEVSLEDQELAEPEALWRIALATEPIDPQDRFYYHKTTARGTYDRFRNSAPQADDVLLWNPRGELTETTLANVAVRLGEVWFTPPVACGLLAGTERAHLLAQGRLLERVLTLADLDRAEELAVFNSLRGWIPARLSNARAARKASLT